MRVCIVNDYVIGGKNSGVVPWALVSGAYGGLTDINNEFEIANEIEKFYKNPKYANEVKWCVYEYVNKTFSVETIAFDYI